MGIWNPNVRVPNQRSTASESIALVSAADDGYSLPLAVTIRSVIDHLSVDQPLDVFILDGGISRRSKKRIESSWQDPRVSVRWLKPDIRRIADLKTEHHLSQAAYLRLFIADVLPASVKRAIYLDSDLLVLNDVRQLWAVNLGDAPLAAIHDFCCPYLNTREAIGRPTLCDNYPDKCLPVPNYRELGLRGSAPYFNSGVMVVNVDQWRTRNVVAKATALIRQHKESVIGCDQYALNILFSDQWRQLDPRWNMQHMAWHWTKAEECPFDYEQFPSVHEEQWIAHFTWVPKPWHSECQHPYTGKYFTFVDRTDWRGWRPQEGLPLPEAGVYARYRRWYRRNVAPVTRIVKHTIFPKKKAA